MITKQQAASYILGHEGVGRDVTFTPTTKIAVITFLKELLSGYTLKSAYDNNGIDRSSQLRSNSPLDSIGGFMHVVLIDGIDLIHHLQVFVDQEDTPDKYSVEVTFRSVDVNQEQFTFERFRLLVEHWNNILKADDYFVRYENASWDLYDSNGLGVIYSRNQMPVD